MLEPGSRFAAYEVLDRLAVGGMGEVYRAKHRLLDRIDALKVLRPHLASDDAFRRRFLREALSAARLRHPHIVTVYTADEVDDQLYLAMEYIEGADLGSVLHTDGPMDPDRVIRLLAETAEALDSAHAMGMAHRDVKPGNVLIQEPGSNEKAYLVDFGLTKAHSVEDQQITATGQVLGSLAYIAPEQIDGVDKGGSVDQYALACVAFEVLTGRIPFVRDNPVASISAHLTAPPPEVTELRGELPRAMNGVIIKGMAKKLEDRYPSCADFVQALSEALHPPAHKPASPQAGPPAAPPSAPFSAPPAGPLQPYSAPPSGPAPQRPYSAPPSGPTPRPQSGPPQAPAAPLGPGGLPYQQPGPGVPQRPPGPPPSGPVYPQQQPPPRFPQGPPQQGPAPTYGPPPGQRPPPSQSGGIPSRTPVPQGYGPPAAYQNAPPRQAPPQPPPSRPLPGRPNTQPNFGPPQQGFRPQQPAQPGFGGPNPPQNNSLSVVVVGGPASGQVLPLPLGESVVGNGGPLAIGDDTLDPQHIRFRVTGWNVTAEPVGSASARLNGAPLAGPQPVRPAQIIDAGSSLLEIRPSDRLSRAGADLTLPDPVSIMASITRPGSPLRRGPQHPMTLLTRVGWRPERPPRVMAIPLGETTGGAIRGEADRAAALVRWVIGQAVGLHDPRDLCLAAALTPVGPERWSWVRALPHARPTTAPLQGPHVAADSEAAADLVNRLLTVLERRRVAAAGGQQQQQMAKHPRVLAILDDSADSPKADELTAHGPALGIHVLRVLGPHRRVPRTCGYCIDIRGPGPAALVVHAGTPGASLAGTADGVDAGWIRNLAEHLEVLD